MSEPLENMLLAIYPAPDEIPESEEEQAPLRERFRITSDDQADWAVRKIAKARKELAQAEKLAETQIARIQAWLESQRKETERTVTFFESLLKAYYLPRFAADPKLRTIKLPAGKVQVRAQQPEFQRDEGVLLTWLRTTGRTNLVEIKESPRWADLKRDVTPLEDGTCIIASTGEVVEGVRAIPRPPVFRVVTEEANEDAVRQSN